MKNKLKKIFGNSGCNIKVYVKNSNFTVIKKSTNKVNSNRLEKQFKKIKKFKKFSKKISIPKLYNFGRINNYFFYEMEFINGELLSEYLIANPFLDSIKIFNQIFQFIKKNKLNSFKNLENEKKILEKIDNLAIIFKEKKLYYKYKFIFKFLKKQNWSNIASSSCHGDLTLENIIIKRNNVYIIDLSENFIESYYLDYSKILFDFISNWSFRNNHNVSHLQYYSLRKEIIKKILNNFSFKEKIKLKCFVLLDFLRVISYTNNKHILLKINFYLKKFYDNFNHPLRW
jgi:tRNA A-37 threonylcarbamoyl transferase component Bud32